MQMLINNLNMQNKFYLKKIRPHKIANNDRCAMEISSYISNSHINVRPRNKINDNYPSICIHILDVICFLKRNKVAF